MKDHVDKSMGIITRIVEDLTRIKPTETLRLAQCEARKKPNYSDADRFPESGTRSAYSDRQEDDGIRSIRVYLTIRPNLHSGCLVDDTIRMRSTGGGHSVCECSVCILSGTSIAVTSHCDIHHECARRDLIIFPHETR
jgi:hypothetical protein